MPPPARYRGGAAGKYPYHLVHADAPVEMDAKMAAGCFSPGAVPDAEELKKATGRGWT